MLVALALVLASVAPASSFGDMEIVRAMEALERGDDARALELLEHFVAGPSRGEMWLEARFLAARAALRLGRGVRAVELLEGLEAELPEIADYLLADRARALRAGGRWRDAAAVWQTLLGAHSTSPLAAEARFGVADAAFALGDLAAANAAYRYAMERSPQSDGAMTARYNLGRIAEMRGEWSEAAAHYRTLAYKNPSHPLHDAARVRHDFIVAAELAPAPSLNQRLYLIDKLLSSHSVEEAGSAIRDADPLATSDTTRRALDFRRAQLAYRVRDHDTAIKLFADLAAHSSGRRRLEYELWLGKTHSSAGQTQQAIEVHRGLAQRYPGRLAREALFRAAWLAYNGGDHPQAMALFGEFVERYPRDTSAAEALWYLGWNAYRLGDLPTAAATLVRLRERYPTSSLVQRAHYWEGRIAALMGELAQAKSSFATAESLRPFDYYGVMARQQLTKLTDLTVAVANGRLFASLEEPSAAPVEGKLEPERDELPEYGGLQPLASDTLPWGASVFDWDSAEGRRAVRLLRLGLVDEAAQIVEDMPAKPGHGSDDVYYARARMLYSMNGFNTAYRIARSAFGELLGGAPESRTRRYFQLAYPVAYDGLVRAASREFSVSPLLVLSLMRQESAFDARARSWASAHGLMQIIPRTGRMIAERLGLREYNYALLRDPSVNIRFGTWYLGQLLRKFHGNAALAVASYNAGPLAVENWIDNRGGIATDEFVEEIPFKETRQYVRAVLSNLAVYSAVYSDKPLRIPEQVPAQYRDNVNF